MLSASRYGFSRTNLAASLPYAFAESDVAQPRVDVRDGCHLSERVVNRVCASRGDALDRTQVLGTLAYDLEHAVAKAVDRLRGPDGSQMGGIGHQEGDDATAIQVIHQFDGLDLYLPAVLGVARPGAAYSHHRPQRDIRRQVTECTDSRAVGLLERENGKPALIAEMDRDQRPAYVRLSAGYERWKRRGRRDGGPAKRGSQGCHRTSAKHGWRRARCLASG
jgi:hypothetical protein